MDAHCKEVHPGDMVNYTLTIRGLSGARQVIADLQMRPLHELPSRGGGLPSPDFRNLGGGGSAQSGGSGQNTFSFSFVVPREIFSGRYHGTEVLVRADEPIAMADTPQYIEVSRHTRRRVHSFCLTVVSPYGAPEQKPEVINFQPGPIIPRQ